MPVLMDSSPSARQECEAKLENLLFRPFLTDSRPGTGESQRETAKRRRAQSTM